MIFAQSLRMTWRDWRAGELYFLMIALIVAVAALSSVSFFIDRMQAGLNRDANQLLGADMVAISSRPIPDAWRAEASRRGLNTAETVVFPSMAIAGQGDDIRSLLSSIKAVAPGYPLRGQLAIAKTSNAAAEKALDVPAPGTVWVDGNLLSEMRLAVGDNLQLGEKRFLITGVIVAEPDRGNAFVNFAPRAMLRLDDLAATGLVQTGSRVTYRLLVAASESGGRSDQPAIASFQTWMQARVDADGAQGVRLESLESGRPEMQATLDRAQQFLALVGLLSAILAAIAVAMAARRFMVRHLDACAMLRCLGLTQNQSVLLYLTEFVFIGIVASLLGVMLGYAAHFGLLVLLTELVGSNLPAPTMMPAVAGVFTGMLLLIGFALPPILQLRNVPHNRVIRREQQPPQAATLLTYAGGGLTFIALLLWQSGDPKLAALTAGGFVACLFLFAAMGWLALQSLRAVRNWSDRPGWRFAITSLQRRPQATVVQIVALSLGLMALLLLTVVRGDLVGAWRQATPPDAPNRFVINIQPDQKEPLEALMKGGGVAKPELYPMIRGRLIAVNGTEINEDTYQEDRARRLVSREFNLSTMHDVPPENSIVKGRWYDNTKPEASVEEGLAKALGLNLGDVLTFDIAGEQVKAPVTSLRKLDWSSMRVNFFVILNPALMADTPQTWITAFHLPEGNRMIPETLARDYPNLSVIDIGNIVRQIQGVLDQVILAVEFLFLFTLASGVLVLYAALVGSLAERSREAGLLRALGATRRQLTQSHWIEFLLVGSLSGMLAATGAALTGWALARFVFEFDWIFSPNVWLVGVGTGALCAFAGGWLGLRSVLSRPPMFTLREA